MTIWKFRYPIEDGDDVTIRMPIGARILSCREQRNDVCLWAVVDPSQPMIERRFRLCGTGQEAPSDETHAYIGTALILGGDFVWHLFEVKT